MFPAASGYLIARMRQSSEYAAALLGPELSPGAISPTQPKVAEAKVRGSPEGFQRVLVSPESAPGVRKGVSRGLEWVVGLGRGNLRDPC